MNLKRTVRHGEYSEPRGFSDNRVGTFTEQTTDAPDIWIRRNRQIRNKIADLRRCFAHELVTLPPDSAWQYVDDLVEGVVRLAASGHPGPINIGNPTEVTMLELAEAIRDICGSASPIAFAPRPEDDPTVRRPDISLARDVLGWEPRVGLDDGLKRTVAWFETSGVLNRVS